MKKMKKLLIRSILIAMILLVSSCSPETYSLDRATNKSDIDFDISQDLVVDPGGNTVILKNLTPGVILNWDYGTGKSNKATQTVKYAFKGVYTVKITAITDGGTVELDPVTVTVTQDNLSYVNDPLWDFLSGGVGKSKTWLLDLDANGVSKYFVGPVYFAGDELGWEKRCEGDAALCWTWDPEWKGNQWVGAKGDYGSMTFSLEGGPFIKVEHKLTTPGTQNGTYFLDVANHELTLTNAAILHSWGDNDIDDWSNYKIITLTKDAMQIGAHNKAKAEYAVFNFISKEYSDNWVGN